MKLHWLILPGTSWWGPRAQGRSNSFIGHVSWHVGGGLCCGGLADLEVRSARDLGKSMDRKQGPAIPGSGVAPPIPCT